MALVGDPEGVGLVETLGHPGRNVTGLTNMTADLAAKRLQLLKEALPAVRRIGVLWNPDSPMHGIALTHLKGVAPELHLELTPISARTVRELSHAFSAFARSKVDAVLVLDDAFTTGHGAEIGRLAIQRNMPLVGGWKPFAKEGALITYSTHIPDLFAKAAEYVDRILKGASPPTLPVQRPTRFELVVNLKVAKEIGVVVPESVLLQADQVIK